MDISEKIKIIILAGGKGKRMQTEMPKVLAPLKGKPMISHLLESIEKTNLFKKIGIIVGYKKEEVIKELGDKYEYITQEEQLGTGHAVMCAKDYIGDTENVLVLYGDSPFINTKTIENIVNKHIENQNKITMATVLLPDFNDWRSFFYSNFSRIIRDENGKIVKSVEFKDANEDEKKILEVNPCYFCFNSKWMFEKLQTLKNDNAQKEYYLTDLVKIAMKDGEKIESININPHEALAANSKEELEILENFKYS
ncbi:NTP transferase domain-containing protein [Candidatus Nomurabacteria bacterium]|nr:NTP transferase domain-containing protein [Candidatus Nomurabacteria bacterium]